MSLVSVAFCPTDAGSPSWSASAPLNEVYRRAGGRRHYNSWRQFCAAYRRLEVARLLLALAQQGVPWHGRQARMARQLGVSEATISRDYAVLHREWLARQQADPFRRPERP